MPHHKDRMHLAAAGLALGLGAMVPGLARAAGLSYKLQSLAQTGDMVGDVEIQDTGYIYPGALNDNGQLAFVVDNAAGGGKALIQYADGKMTPVVEGGKDAPGGKWPKDVFISWPVSMNQQGNIAFAAGLTAGGKTTYGTFLWDYPSKKVTAVALKGMPAVSNLTFEQGGDYAPRINGHGEIAFSADVKDAAGDTVAAVFFQGADGKLQPVAVPDQPLPGGRKIHDAILSSLNDAGVVGFAARTSSNGSYSTYRWEKGTVTPIALAGTAAPGGGTFGSSFDALLNNKDPSALVPANVRISGSWSFGLFRWSDSGLARLVLPGDSTPQGGRFANVLPPVSFASEAGQNAFFATLADGATAAYLLSADDSLSLIVKSGMTTPLGKITQVGAGDVTGNSYSNGVALNDKGQVALTVKFDGGVDTLVLLTPSPP